MEGGGVSSILLGDLYKTFYSEKRLVDRIQSSVFRPAMNGTWRSIVVLELG